MGTQKSRLNETVLLFTQNMLKLMGKKIITILRSKILLIETYGVGFEFFKVQDLWNFQLFMLQ